jgi:protein-disulfide isomerase
MRDENDRARLTLAVVEHRDHIQGPPTAAATMVEYGDFECSYCGQAYPVLKELAAQFGDRMRLVFRHFPLTQIHPHAEQAAEASEAAAAQGRFWEMHDALYENQGALEDDDLLAYAGAVGLDVNRFEVEMAQHAHFDRVREDFVSGVRSGVNGTPSFFLNGRRYDGTWDLPSLVKAVNASMHWHDTGAESAGQRPHFQ